MGSNTAKSKNEKGAASDFATRSAQQLKDIAAKHRRRGHRAPRQENFGATC